MATQRVEKRGVPGGYYGKRFQTALEVGSIRYTGDAFSSLIFVVAVAERHYLGVVRGIPREVRTLERAMQTGDLLELMNAGGKVIAINGAG